MADPELGRLVDRMVGGHEQSRREFLRRLAGTGLLLGSSSALLSACGIQGEAQKRAKVAAHVHHPKVPIGNWTFSNWPLYVDKKVVTREFDKRFGGHVRYVEEINDNFEFFGKVRQQLQRGQPIGRDMVVITDYLAARWVRDGYCTPIDHRNIPNMANMQDNLRDPRWDPGRSFSMPWQSGATGIGYNPRLTGRKLHSVNDLFDPAFKGRVTMISEPYDAASLVMLGMGVDCSTAKIDDAIKAIDKIDEFQKKGQFRRFTGNDFSQDLTSGNSWISMAYSGDIYQLQADNPELEFLFPDEGAAFWTDNMLVPAKAAHPYAAETMMNYVYEPEVAAKIAEYVAYISPVKGVRDILQKSDPKLANSPLTFPSDELRKKLRPYPTLTPSDERQMQERMAQVTGA